MGREILGWVISFSPNSGEIPPETERVTRGAIRLNSWLDVGPLVSRFECNDLIGSLRNDGGWCRTIMCMKRFIK